MRYKKKKEKSIPMPHYDANEEEQEAYMFCVEKGIRVSPGGTKELRKWSVDYSVDNKTWHKSKFVYDEDQIWPTYYEVCKYFKTKWEKENTTKDQ